MPAPRCLPSLAPTLPTALRSCSTPRAHARCCRTTVNLAARSRRSLHTRCVGSRAAHERPRYASASFVEPSGSRCLHGMMPCHAAPWNATRHHATQPGRPRRPSARATTCGLLPHDAAVNPPVAVVRAPCHAAPLLPRAAPPNRWTCHTAARPFRLRIPCLASFVRACLILRHVPLCATYHSAEHCVCPLPHEDGRSAAGERYLRSSGVGCAQHAIF